MCYEEIRTLHSHLPSVLKGRCKSVFSVNTKQVGVGGCKELLTAGNGLTQKIMKCGNKRQQKLSRSRNAVKNTDYSSEGKQ